MYCKNCGKEVDENAYVCLNCGALIKEDHVSQSKDDKGNNVEKLKNAKNILLTIAFFFSSFSLFFLIHTLFNIEIKQVSSKYSPTISFNYGSIITALVFSIISVVIHFIAIIIKYNFKQEKNYDIIYSFIFSLFILMSVISSISAIG